MSEIEFLSADICWDLLGSVPIGRLAVIVDQQPDIFPVNYAVDNGSIVFRTADGTKWVAAARGAAVAFEADGYDAATGQAWSVVVKGRPSQIRQMRELLDAAHLPLSPWPAEPKRRFVRIEAEEISGRRFELTDPADWATDHTRTHPTPFD